MATSKVAAKGNATAVSLIDPDQVRKASRALLDHIKEVAATQASQAPKRDILAENEGDGASSVSETPIWLTLTTKRHIVDSNRLKPHTITLPHTLNSSSDTTICLITADPQRAYKNIVASAEFPEALRERVTRVIDFTHLKAKFKQYEAQRKLFSEHDIFLGDDRIINRLPKVLGKTFYKSTAKRPVPVAFGKPRGKVDGKRLKREKSETEINARSPSEIAREVERAIGAALVALSSSTNTAIKVGYADWDHSKLAANIETVVRDLVLKYVPQQWKNVKAIYIKGPRSSAVPIWQADELWLESSDVQQEGSELLKIAGASKQKANIGKKRKAPDAQARASNARAKKAKLQEDEIDHDDRRLGQHRDNLKRQKAASKKALEA